MKEAVEADKLLQLCQKMWPRQGSIIVGIKQVVTMATYNLASWVNKVRFAGMTLNLTGFMNEAKEYFGLLVCQHVSVADVATGHVAIVVSPVLAMLQFILQICYYLLIRNTWSSPPKMFFWGALDDFAFCFLIFSITNFLMSDGPSLLPQKETSKISPPSKIIQAQVW